MLTEKALNGDLINNAYTTVHVEEKPEDNTTVVEIDRVISEKVYDNGEIITENQKTVTTIVNDEVLYSLAGSKEETTKPASSSVSIKAKIPYDKRTIKGHVTYKLTNYSLTPRILDSQFSLTKLTHEARSFGSGFLANGKSYTKTESTGILTISNPKSISTYNKSLSFVKYVIPNTVAGAGTSVNGDLHYKRKSNGATYKVHYVISP